MTSWPFEQYVQHEWAGAWVNSLFRNETCYKASQLIMEAVAATRWFWWPEVPTLGMVTFVNGAKVKRKREPGWVYKKAGFTHVGYTKGGLHVWQMLPSEMPWPKGVSSVA